MLIILSFLTLVHAFCPDSDGSKTYLRFTKDLNAFDFANVGQYKELPCCVDGFDSITWTREDEPLEDSSFSVLKNDQQLLVSKYTRLFDTGNYTCNASNATHTLTHRVRLRVFAIAEYTGSPLPTFPPTDQWAEIGESALFRCSAFLGSGTKRQERNSELYWIRSNNSFEFAERENHSISWEENYTTGGQILSSYLNISEVDDQDFGEYICVANNGEGYPLHMSAHLHRGVDPKTKIRNSYTVAIAMFVVSALMTFAITITYLSRRTQIHLFFKDRFAPLEDPQGVMRYDVFICYNSSDSSELVCGWLVPRLEQNYGYSCFVFERDLDGGDWMPDVFAARIRESRRFLLVLSRGVICDGLCRLACQLAVQEALNPKRSFRLICAVPSKLKFQDLMEATDPGGALRMVFTVARRAMLPPKHGASQREHARFWRELRLRLPPRRPEPSTLTYRILDDTTTPL
ncbi:hypothetical protein B566_EDAN009628 [Ephemera danica]|nr:hypothetical protein B566_EDAN009628 [Ephemera danica]